MSETSVDLRAAIEAAAGGEDWSDVGGSPPEAGPQGGAASDGARARDDAGRFAAKEAGKDGGGPPAAGQAPGAQQAAQPEDDFEDGIGFERDAWGRLPAEVRPTIKGLAQQRREAEARAKGFEPMDAALAPVRDAWTMAYGGVPQALQQLIAIERVARENPAEFVRQFVQQRRMDPAALFGQQQGQQGQQGQQQDPMEILRAEVRRSLQEETQQADTTRALQAFEVDASLEHRQNPTIRRAMAGLLQTGVAPDLTTAYDMAIHADPGIRAKLAEAQAADRAKQERERAAQAAAERQNAAVSTTGGPGTTRPVGDAASPNSTRDIASRAWDAASGRV